MSPEEVEASTKARLSEKVNWFGFNMPPFFLIYWHASDEVIKKLAQLQIQS